MNNDIAYAVQDALYCVFDVLPSLENVPNNIIIAGGFVAVFVCLKVIKNH